MSRPPGVRLYEAEHPAAVAPRAPHRSSDPVRTCVGCRRRSARSVLLRVVAIEVDGVWSVVPDPAHKLAGRGASLHLDLACFGRAERRRAFGRALRQAGPLSLDPLRNHLAAVAGPTGTPPDTEDHPAPPSSPGSGSTADEHSMSTQR